MDDFSQMLNVFQQIENHTNNLEQKLGTNLDSAGYIFIGLLSINGFILLIKIAKQLFANDNTHLGSFNCLSECSRNANT